MGCPHRVSRNVCGQLEGWALFELGQNPSFQNAVRARAGEDSRVGQPPRPPHTRILFHHSSTPVQREFLIAPASTDRYGHFALEKQILISWLKGHAGHVGNERCDQLANAEIANIKKAFSSEQLKELLAQFSVKDNAEQTSDEMFES